MSEWKPTSIHDAFGHKDTKSNQFAFWRFFAILSLALVGFLLYLMALSNRYTIVDSGVFDSWTRKVYLLKDLVVENHESTATQYENTSKINWEEE